MYSNIISAFLSQSLKKNTFFFQQNNDACWKKLGIQRLKSIISVTKLASNFDVTEKKTDKTWRLYWMQIFLLLILYCMILPTYVFICFQDDGLVEVWLTSQDFIGLGFNIAGSMRDGIFVSQVHNRGPANESGKFKTGNTHFKIQRTQTQWDYKIQPKQTIYFTCTFTFDNQQANANKWTVF